ncbi:hypothetical protein DPMN_062563 [Dreissena polymorpha]|uniref:Uncharacterized protein n=1 Tax=Dreissena polymorpha TaxID=45954 RepID=A0A9D4C8Y7_DREPO|nr:hypothetical protein DPMN_062563 [Dreissena polymorpha]
MNVTFRALTIFEPAKTIFELVQDIIWTNLSINLASRVLTMFYNSHIMKNAQPNGGHFHDDFTLNVASRVLTRFYYSHIRKNALPLGGHVFQPTLIIFKLAQDIIGMNHQTLNVASRVKNALPPVQDIIEENLLTKFHEDRKCI